MKITVDITNKTIEMPKELERTEDILKAIDFSTFRRVYKKPKKTSKPGVVDKINMEIINNYMEGVKASDEALYNEYIELRESVERQTPTGKPIKTNFLSIKKWFYKHYPEEKGKYYKENK